MSTTEKITFRLSRAKGAKDNRAPLSEFANVCLAMRKCLKHIGRCLGREDVKFAISDLHFGSACLVAVPEAAADTEVATVFNDTIGAIQEDRRLDWRLDYTAIHCFREFDSTIKNRELSLKMGEHLLTNAYTTNLSVILEPAGPALGSIAGRLDIVNVHQKNEFTLFPPIAGEKIICKFDEKDRGRVLGAVGRNVTVFGMLHYVNRKAFPVHVDVNDFTVEPEDDELPTLLDAKGILIIPSNAPAAAEEEWSNGWQ